MTSRFNRAASRRRFMALSILVFSGWAGVAPAQGTQSSLTVQLDADSTRADGPNGVIEFTGITISQGALRVQADSARSSGLDFENSAWTFSGNVRFRDAETQLVSESAVLRFSAQQLSDATLTGAPLRFERQRDGDTRLTATDGRVEFEQGKLARAYFNGAPVRFEQGNGERSVESHANSLTYDAQSGTITLQDDAHIAEGGREISGNRIVYNFVERSVVAASDDSGQQRVRITIKPSPQNDIAKPPASATETPEP